MTPAEIDIPADLARQAGRTFTCKPEGIVRSASDMRRELLFVMHPRLDVQAWNAESRGLGCPARLLANPLAASIRKMLRTQ